MKLESKFVIGLLVVIALFLGVIAFRGGAPSVPDKSAADLMAQYEIAKQAVEDNEKELARSDAEIKDYTALAISNGTIDTELVKSTLKKMNDRANQLFALGIERKAKLSSLARDISIK